MAFSSLARFSAALASAKVALALATLASCWRSWALISALFSWTSTWPAWTTWPSSALTATAVRPPVSAPTGTSSQGEIVPVALIWRAIGWLVTVTTLTVADAEGAALAFFGFLSPQPDRAIALTPRTKTSALKVGRRPLIR